MLEEQDLHSDKSTTWRFRGTKGFLFFSQAGGLYRILCVKLMVSSTNLAYIKIISPS